MQKLPTLGEIHTIKADKEIKYSYFLYIPQNTKIEKIVLWFHPSTPPNPQDLLEDSAMRSIRKIKEHCEQLGYVAIMPVLPRENTREEFPFYKYDSQIMTKEVMTTDLKGNDEYFYRPDIAVVKLLNKVKTQLAENDIKVEHKVIVGGFSAGAVFANRFSILYPEQVSTTILLSAGLFTYPINSLHGLKLEYPFGTSDLGIYTQSHFSAEAFNTIRHFIYVGELENSSENDILAYELNGNEKNLKLIGDVIGYDPLTRTKYYANYLEHTGMSVELLIAPNTGHQADPSVYSHAFQFATKVEFE